MRNLILLLTALWLSSCSLFEDQLPRYSVTITDIQNERDGTRVSFTVDNDGKPISVAGAAFGRDSLFNTRNNQVLADTLSNTQLSVLLTGADDGVRYFQAFAAFEDGFYALSESVGFDVVSSAPNTSCNPPNNSLNFASERCGAGSVSVRAELNNRNELYEITASCQSLYRNTLKLTFPRNPTSGTYRTVSSQPRSGTTSKEVLVTAQVSSSFSTLPQFQEVFVSRSGGRTTITLCDNSFFFVGAQRPLTGRIVFDN